MSTLTERAAALKPRMTLVREAEAGEELTGKLRIVDEALSTHYTEVVSLVACVTALRGRGLLPETFPSAFHARDMLERLLKLKERLATAPQRVFHANFWATMNQALKTSTQTLREELLKVWGQYLDGLTPSLEGLRDLIQSDVFGENFRRIGRLQGEIDTMRQTLPASVAAIEAAAAKGQEIKKLVADLDFDQIPAEVNRFLKAVLIRSVTLAEFEPAVHAWLVEKNLGGAFRITSARSR